MEFSLTEGQRIIRETARDFLKKECPSDLVREMEKDNKGFSPVIWRKIAEMGWLGLIFPAEYGGSGGNFLDLIILLEQMGQYLVPIPFLPTVILGGLPILYGGTEGQKKEFLSKIANGELIMSMAFTELEPIYSAAGINLRAIREGSSFLIHGVKLFVPYAHVADHLVCATRTERAEKKEEGITLFLIKGKDPGIGYAVLRTLSGEKQCEVVFNNVRVTEESVLGEYNRGWETLKKVLEEGTVAECALMVGGAEKVLEMTVNHAKERVQFNRPIGSFQAIQHRCANMKVDLEGARLATYEAAWRISQGLPSTLEVSVAKAWVNQAYNRICANGHQIHGGSGVMKDYDMELYSRRAKAEEFFLGDTRFHKEIVAEMLGL